MINKNDLLWTGAYIIKLVQGKDLLTMKEASIKCNLYRSARHLTTWLNLKLR